MTNDAPLELPQSSGPQGLSRGSLLPLLVLAFSFAYLCLFRRCTTMDPDEGIILQGAQRILQGQVLYRDFFSFFTPGSYYLLALLFRIFGSSMLVARTALVFYGSLFPVFTYLVARRVCSRWSALLTAYLVIVTCLPWRFMWLHNWDSTLWACAAVYCAVRWVEATNAGAALQGHPRESGGPGSTGVDSRLRGNDVSGVPGNDIGRGWAFATGTLVALTVLFEQSKGAGLVLGLSAGFLLVHVGARLAAPSTGQGGCGRAGPGLKGGASPAPTAGRHGDWIALAMGFTWPFAVTFAYFASQHALPQMVADWLWPLHNYSRANSVLYGTQNWSDSARHEMFGSGSWTKRTIVMVTVTPCFVIPALPLVAAVLLAYWVRETRAGRLDPARSRYYMLTCSSLLGVLVSLLIVRPDNNHFAYVIPFFYLVLAWLFDGSDIRARIVNAMKPAVTLIVVLTFTAVGMAFLVARGNARAPIRTRRGVLCAAKPDGVIEYTQAHLQPGSKVFVYPYLPLYYYLTATFNPTRYEYLQPGMHTREQDEEAIREIEADRTRVVLFEPDFNEKLANSWPNTPIQYVANDPVGDYLLAHYRSCKILRSASGWPFLFMVRKGVACPKDSDE